MERPLAPEWHAMTLTETAGRDDGSEGYLSDKGSDGDTSAVNTEAPWRRWWGVSMSPAFLGSKASRRDLWLIILPVPGVLSLVPDLVAITEAPSVVAADIIFAVFCICLSMMPRNTSVTPDFVVAGSYFLYVVVRRVAIEEEPCFGSWELIALLSMATGGVHSIALACFTALSLSAAPMLGECWKGPDLLVACIYVLCFATLLEFRLGHQAVWNSWSRSAFGAHAEVLSRTGYIGSVGYAKLPAYSRLEDIPPPLATSRLSSRGRKDHASKAQDEFTTHIAPAPGNSLEEAGTPPTTQPPNLGSRAARAAAAAVDSLATSLTALLPSCAPRVAYWAASEGEGSTSDEAVGSEELHLTGRGSGLAGGLLGDAESGYAEHGPPRSIVVRAAPRRRKLESSSVRPPVAAAATPESQTDYEFDTKTGDDSSLLKSAVKSAALTLEAEARGDFDEKLFEVGTSAPEPQAVAEQQRTLPPTGPHKVGRGPTSPSASSSRSLPAGASGSLDFTRCVKLVGFQKRELNNMYVERTDPDSLVYGRATFWTPQEDYFLHYSIQFRAWALVPGKRFTQARAGEWCAVALAPRGNELKEIGSKSGASTPTSVRSTSTSKRCWKEWDPKAMGWVARDGAGVSAVGRARRVQRSTATSAAPSPKAPDDASTSDSGTLEPLMPVKPPVPVGVDSAASSLVDGDASAAIPTIPELQEVSFGGAIGERADLGGTG